MILQNLLTNKAEVFLLSPNFELLIALLTLATSFVTTLLVMPNVIAISIEKNLTATTNGRTSHKGIVPNLGGIGVFVGLLLTMNTVFLLLATYEQLIHLIIFNIALSILFLVGVCDDIMTISPLRKLAFQLVAALLFTFGTNYYIDSFAGLFGLHQLNYFAGIVFSVFVIVLIINAYNLIDGIDGLAGALGSLISGIMAVVFYLSDNFLLALISLALAGSLIAFLLYNFSHRRKIFLGDTGSMVVGFVLATLVVIYLNKGTENTSPLFKNAPLFVLALLSYPLLDTLRVFIVRIKKGKSPFAADRNHIHHRLIDLKLSHKYATLYVVCYTVVVITLAYFLNNLPINLSFLILMPVSLGFLGLPFVVERKKNCPGFQFDWTWRVAERENA